MYNATLVSKLVLVALVVAASPFEQDVRALPDAAIGPFRESLKISEHWADITEVSAARDNKVGSLHMKVDGSREDPQKAQAALVKYYTPMEGLGDPRAFSDLPLGDVVFSAVGPATTVLRSRTGRFIVEVAITARPERSATGVRWRRDDPEGDAERVEGIARYLTARQAYRASTAAASRSVAGTQVSARTFGGRPEPWVAIQDWARARGASLRVNERRGTAQLTLNGVDVIVPLGAKRIKVGTEWADLPGPVAWWDSDWYVPLGQLP